MVIYEYFKIEIMKINWQLVFNPFQKFGEIQLLITGVLAAIIGSLIASLSGVTFDGILDLHLYPNQTLISVSIENSINILICFVLFFVTGKIANAKTRAIDILNTAIIYRIPIYILCLIINIPLFKNLNSSILNSLKNGNSINLKNGMPDLSSIDLFTIIIFGLIAIAVLVISVVFMINGFKTATNAKKVKHWILFAMAIIIGEIISKRLITHIINGIV